MRTVISASRRTDVPAFYLRWLDYHLRRGFVDVRNPVVKNNTYRVSLLPESVHTLVLWSKNYGPFLASRLARDASYRWYFNFSLVDTPEWELAVPPLDERLEQVIELCRRWSPRHVNWRFDPIVFWDEGRRHNLERFEPLCDFMAGQGVTRCTFSFVTWYNKIRRRTREFPIQGFDPPLSQKLDILARLSAYARARGIVLESCSNDELLAAAGVVKGRCIHGDLLAALAGEPCTRAKDPSQRANCGCTKSADIGSYDMSCPHACMYCYAKPILRPAGKSACSA